MANSYPRPEHRFSNSSILERLGGREMDIVYKAKDTRSRRYVAPYRFSPRT